MAVFNVLARDYDFAVSTDNVTYTTISGIKSWTLASDDTDNDTTDFDNDGMRSVMVVSTQWTLSLEGNYEKDDVTGARDAGQAMVDASLASFGPSRFRYYRVSAVTGSGVLTFRGSAKRGELGGGNDDTLMWTVDIPFAGKPLTKTGEFSAIFPA